MIPSIDPSPAITGNTPMRRIRHYITGQKITVAERFAPECNPATGLSHMLKGEDPD